MFSSSRFKGLGFYGLGLRVQGFIIGATQGVTRRLHYSSYGLMKQPPQQRVSQPIGGAWFRV